MHVVLLLFNMKNYQQFMQYGIFLISAMRHKSNHGIEYFYTLFHRRRQN